jgi:hypothetical protein
VPPSSGPGSRTPPNDPVLSATAGRVVYRESGCDYFVVETSGGHSLVEWFGGSFPEVGDILRGDFQHFGFTDVYNETRRADMHIWIDDYWLSESSVAEKFRWKCPARRL